MFVALFHTCLVDIVHPVALQLQVRLLNKQVKCTQRRMSKSEESFYSRSYCRPLLLATMLRLLQALP